MIYPAPKMKTKKDCGLTAMTWVFHKLTGRNYDEIYERLKEIMEYSDVDFDDNPAEHERVINRYSDENGLGVKFSLVEPIKLNLFSGNCPNNKTVILIKYPYKESQFDFLNELGSTLKQHWIVLKSVDTENKMIDIWYGDGNYQRWSFEKAEELIISGIFPNCVYVVGEYDPIENPWYSKLYMNIANFILKLFQR